MHWKQKSEFFKKNKGSNPAGSYFSISPICLCLTLCVIYWPAPAPVITPTKSVSKVKISNNNPKGNISSSPAPSPEQPGASNRSFPVGSDANNEVITPFDLNKEENSKYEKSTASKMSNKGIDHRASSQANVDDNTVRSHLISVLSKYPKGMGLKVINFSSSSLSMGHMILIKFHVQMGKVLRNFLHFFVKTRT